MASQNPSTPVKVPPSAASYTNATLDSDLRSQINMVLMKEGLVTKIQEHLLHTLNANSANWPTTVQNHALSLLRSGEITTFPALLRRVIEDVRQETAAGPAFGSGSNGTETNGKRSSTNGTPSAGETNGNSSSSTSGLAVPHSVVEDALKVTRESLETGSSKEWEEDHPYGHIFTDYYNHNTTTSTQATEEMDPTNEGRLGNTGMEPDEDMTMKGVEQDAGGGTSDSRSLTEALQKAYLSSTDSQGQGGDTKG